LLHSTDRNRFPDYKSPDKFSIWAESYGGHYGPTFADYFIQQNTRIDTGELGAPAKKYEIETVGLMNACIDLETQMPLYPEYAFNNTYGIKAINESAYKASVEAVPECLRMAKECRALADSKDPEALGNNQEVNDACHNAYKFCFQKVNGAFQASGVSANAHLRYHFAGEGMLTKRFAVVPVRHCYIGSGVVPAKMGGWVPQHQGDPDGARRASKLYRGLLSCGSK
jgi:carboxypeptidase C (cathepsin A)